MAEMLPEMWDQVLAINATGAYNCIHAVLPQMRSLPFRITTFGWR